MSNIVKANILVVDDEEVTRRLLDDFFSDIGYKVTTACDGEEGLGIAREQPFDLVISDIRMPGMNGVELIKSIRSINAETSFIAITGYASIETAISAVKNGAYDYIIKPFNLDELRIIVQRAIDRQALLREAKQKEYFKELTILDSLTQVYNHRYFHELIGRELNRAVRYPQDFSIMMVDIDNFKKINETAGHLAGDCILKSLAGLMLKSIRRVDLVCRYGGEEFVIIMPHTDKQGGLIAAKRLVELVANTEMLDEKGSSLGKVTVSVGLSSYPNDGQSKENLISALEKAVAQAKSEGKNRVCSYTIEKSKDK